MCKYINAEGRVIIASSKAYALFYKEQGYLPLQESLENNTIPEQDELCMNIEGQFTREKLLVLGYTEIKEIAKQLDIPKYANTKKDQLIELILEKQNDGDDSHVREGTSE